MDDPTSVLLKSRSSWYKLKKSVAAVMTLKTFLQTRQPVEKEIRLVNLKIAEIYIIQYYQNECYSEELKCIKNGTNISCSSPLRKLDPFLDSHHTLRVGGRLSNLCLLYTSDAADE